MKKFILNILTFIAVIMIIILTFELLLRNVPNNYSYKKNYLDKHAQDINILILGSSHTYYGINPQYMTANAFNAATSSQSLKYDFEIFNLYKDKLENLKYLILPISSFSPWYTLENGNESWRIMNYVIYYGMKSPSPIYNFEFLGNKFNVSINKIFSYYIKDISSLSCSEFGAGIHNSDSRENFEQYGFKAASRHNEKDLYSAKNVNAYNEHLLLVDSIASIAKAKNVKLLLITPPTDITYYKNLNEEQLKLVSEFVETITEKHDNCQYINLLKNADFNNNDFYDSDHLNNDGNQKLTSILNNIIEYKHN